MIKKGHKRGTIIHGIGSSSHLDSSGERIKIEGVDISSLTSDGVANWEHKSGEASQIVGKIIEAKKIIKESDCENDHHRYFWNKVKMPYIYIAIELFDEEGHEGAKSVAAMARYDKKTDKRQTKRLINFSIEGSRLEKDGADILKCIARKISITIHPCNKVCEAETMDPIEESSDKNLLQDILGKKEESYCKVMKMEPKYMPSLAPKKLKPRESKVAGYVPPNKHAVGAENHKEGTSVKPQRSFEAGKESKDWKVGDQTTYSNKRPKTGTEIYGKMPKVTGKPIMGKSKEMTVSTKDMVEEHEKVVDVLESPSHKDDKKEAKKQKKELKEYKEKLKKKADFYDSNVKKALTAGSGMSAPGQKEGGSTLAGEHVEKDMHKLMDKSVEFLEHLDPKERAKRRVKSAKAHKEAGDKKGMKENLDQARKDVAEAKKPKKPSNQDLEYPMAASEKAHLDKNHPIRNLIIKPLKENKERDLPQPKDGTTGVNKPVGKEKDKQGRVSSGNSERGADVKRLKYHEKKQKKRDAGVKYKTKETMDWQRKGQNKYNAAHDSRNNIIYNRKNKPDLPKSEKDVMKVISKTISDDNWNTFSKKEELISFLSIKMPNSSHKEIMALAKTVAYVHEKKKEIKLAKMIEDDMEDNDVLEKSKKPIHQSVHNIGGIDHEITTHKKRKGSYISTVRSKEGQHVIHSDIKGNRTKHSHEQPYGTNAHSENNKQLRNRIGEIANNHHNKGES